MGLAWQIARRFNHGNKASLCIGDIRSKGTGWWHELFKLLMIEIERRRKRGHDDTPIKKITVLFYSYRNGTEMDL